MAKKTNPKLIGGFVVGAIVLTIIGVLAFGGSQFLAKQTGAVLFFEGQSLGGLDVGSPVTFRGVKVGTVTGIIIQYDIKKQLMQIPVHIEIDTSRIQVVSGERNTNNIKGLVKLGLRAQLVTQSLVTGQTSVDFDFHPDSPLTLVGTEPGGIELPTIPSDLNVLKANLSDTLEKINKLPLQEIAARILDAVNSANDTLKSFQLAAKNADQLLSNVNDQVNPLSTSLIDTSTQAKSTLKEAQSRLELRDGEPMQNLNETLVDARKLISRVDGNMPAIMAAANQSLTELGGAMSQAQLTLRVAQKSISPDSPLYFELNSTLRELQAAATAIRIFAEYIQRNPNALLTGKR
jgi:paraquat-inducible protein B